MPTTKTNEIGATPASPLRRHENGSRGFPVKRFPTIVAIAAILLVAAIGWYVYPMLSSPPERSANAVAPADQTPSKQTINGQTVIVVPTDVQHASGIEVEPVAQSTARPDREAYARVVDLRPLFDLHYRIAAAREDVESATAAARASRAQYERDQTLIKDASSISQKTFQDAHAVMQADQDKLDSAKISEEKLAASLRLQFGDDVASAAKSRDSALFQKLSRRQTALLLVSLPADAAATAPAEITVAAPPAPGVTASRISAAPQADPATQGVPYFYLTDHAIAVGTTLVAHFPSNVGDLRGVLIPDRAILWYGGQRWAYVQTGSDRFARRAVQSPAEADGGLVVANGFNRGDRVVVQGAQLLLSEDLRPQGIATQCKDPPECDD